MVTAGCKNGRLKKFPFLEQKIAAPDNITIQSIKAISLAAFENSNKVISDEETEATKVVLKDVTEGNSGDAKADAAAKKAQELNVSTEEINKTGGDMLDTFKNISKAYSVVDDLGEAARWNTVTSELSVLQNGVPLSYTSFASKPSRCCRIVCPVYQGIFPNVSTTLSPVNALNGM